MSEIIAIAMASTIIIVGFICNYFFEKTGFPDMLLLIILGMVLGKLIPFVMPEFQLANIMELAPYLAALALVFILFDGGIKMNIFQVFAESPRAVVLAVTNFILSVLAVTLFMHYVVGPFVGGIDIIKSALFGAIYGGSSSIAIVSLAQKIKISERCSTILSLESAITDILCIVVTLAIIEIILGGNQAGAVDVGRSIAARFSIGAVVGVIFGIFWLSILRKVAKLPYAYMLTLGVLLFAYSISEYLEGSGALSCLLFGIVLGNEREINRMLKRERPSLTVVDIGFRRFEEEIAFLIRSFFFVYLGLIVVGLGLSLATILWGIILSFILLFVRYAGVVLAAAKSELVAEKPVMWVLLTRGLAAAVLSTIPMQHADKFGLELSNLYIQIAVVIILVTAVICTLGTYLISKKRGTQL